jgi:peptidoglycan hydrolase-like protein with peptidoglycan-binding domain
VVTRTIIVNPSGGAGLPWGSGPLAPGYQIPFAGTSADQSQNATSTPASVSGAIPLSFVFTKDLKFKMSDPDVLKLQQYLNAHGVPLADTGYGAKGEETDYFGPLTLRAVIRFQEAHAAEILVPLGLSQGTGYFGPSTRAFINAK